MNKVKKNKNLYIFENRMGRGGFGIEKKICIDIKLYLLMF